MNMSCPRGIDALEYAGYGLMVGYITWQSGDPVGQ